MTTLFSINNASALGVLAHVVIWSDLAAQVMDFNVYLTGYDVQVINLRDILVNGLLPQTASTGQDPSDTISPRGVFSQDINFANCTGQLPTPRLSNGVIGYLQAALTGKPNPLFTTPTDHCFGLNYGDNVARGYITVDTVNNCTLRFPDDPGYFPSGTGDATDQNVLLGDYSYVNSATSFAEGYTMVHIEADPQSAQTSTPGQYTFYGRYVGWNATDHREPLATNFFARYQNGGIFDAGTTARVWRDTKVTAGQTGGYQCKTKPAWYPLGQEQIVIFDEQEHAQVQQSAPFPAAAQATKVGGASFPSPYPSGWIYFNLNTTVVPGGNVPPEDPGAAQAWLTMSMGSSGHFSAGHDAFPVDSACSASHKLP
jgi:hypothetical protein